MYPRVAVCVILLKILSVATAAPVESATVIASQSETLNCSNETSDVYDQRQNGTENYRIHVNGVVVLIAPADAVLQAAQLGALQVGPGESEGSNGNLNPQPPLKPQPKPPTATDKVPNENHIAETTAFHPKASTDKNNLKLLNLLHMFRSIRHDSERTLRPE